MYILFVKLSFLHARAKMKIYQTGIPVFWEIKTQIKLVTPNPVASEESNYANPGFALSAFQPPLTLHINLVIPDYSHLWDWGDKCRSREMKRLLSLFPVFLCYQRCSARDPLSKDVPSKTSFYRRLPFLNNCSFHPFSHPKENCKMHRTIYGGDYQIRLIGSHWFARQFLLCNKLHQWNSLKMYLYSIDPRPGILIQDQIFQSNRAENWPIWESTYRLDNNCSLWIYQHREVLYRYLSGMCEAEYFPTGRGWKFTGWGVRWGKKARKWTDQKIPDTYLPKNIYGFKETGWKGEYRAFCLWKIEFCNKLDNISQYESPQSLG